jgi:hypothetical protein
MLIRLFLLCAMVAVVTAAGGMTAHAATHAGIGDRLTSEVPDPEPPVTVEPPTPEPPDPEPPVTVAPEAPPALATAHSAAPPQAASHVAQPSAPRSRRAASVSSPTRRAANSRVRSRSSASGGSATPATRIGNRARGHSDVRRATIAHRLHSAGNSVRRSRPESPVAVHRRRPATAMKAVPVAVAGARLPGQNVTMPRLATSDRGNAVPLWSVIGFTLLIVGLRTFRPTHR